MPTGDPPWTGDPPYEWSQGPIRAVSPISPIEKEILHRLLRLEDMMVQVCRVVDEIETEKKFLRIRNQELEQMLSGFRMSCGSVPESSRVPEA